MLPQISAGTIAVIRYQYSATVRTLSYLLLEPGQIQILDNRRLGCKRTRFEDWQEPERRRTLIRLWLRDHGRPFYNGCKRAVAGATAFLTRYGDISGK